MFAAIHLPALEAVAALRHCPEYRDFPCAVISSGLDQENDPKAKLPILAVNVIAARAGIASGWPLGRALVRCPGLKILPQQPQEKLALLKKLIDQAEALTADLEITAPDVLVLDLSRAPSRKLALLDEMEIPNAEIWHCRAATPDLAHLAVLREESYGSLVDLPFIQRMPLHAISPLPGMEDLLPMLRLWGLRTLGDYLKLPRHELADRLGPAAGHAHDILSGKACRLLRLHRPPVSLGQAYDFEDPVHLTEPLVFAGKRLLHTLSARVSASYLAIATLEITLHLESRATLTRSIRLSEPMVDPVELLNPIQTFLESVQLPSPVTGFDLDATTTSPNPAQREWFGRQLPNPNRWADTIARLQALLGEDRIGIPVSENTHRPDAFKLLSPLSSSFDVRCPVSDVRCSLPLRRFRPPKPVTLVSTIEEHIPTPHTILNGDYSGEITALRGPFILSGQWWEDAREWHHLEWDIELDGRLMRLAYLPPSIWHLEGIYA
jgi:protein ImuB